MLITISRYIEVIVAFAAMTIIISVLIFNSLEINEHEKMILRGIFESSSSIEFFNEYNKANRDRVITRLEYNNLLKFKE